MKHHLNLQPHVVEDHFLRLPQVLARSGMSKTSIYKLIRDGSFPAQVKLGPRTSAWRASEIAKWIARQG
ncbi:helix-turn-helix transcriptional regulator [Roseateles sp. GG27B]